MEYAGYMPYIGTLTMSLAEVQSVLDADEWARFNEIVDNMKLEKLIDTVPALKNYIVIDPYKWTEPKQWCQEVLSLLETTQWGHMIAACSKMGFDEFKAYVATAFPLIDMKYIIHGIATIFNHYCTVLFRDELNLSGLGIHRFRVFSEIPFREAKPPSSPKPKKPKLLALFDEVTSKDIDNKPTEYYKNLKDAIQSSGYKKTASFEDLAKLLAFQTTLAKFTSAEQKQEWLSIMTAFYFHIEVSPISVEDFQELWKMKYGIKTFDI